MAAIRSLDYPAIKAGMRKAGVVPDDASDTLRLIAWLSQAGYGKACLPSLKDYIRLKRSFRHGDVMSQRRGKRRGSGTSMTYGEREKLTTKFKLIYPGAIQNPKKAIQHAARAHRYQYRSFSRDHQSLEVRLVQWKEIDGPLIKAVCELHQAYLSGSRVVDIRKTGRCVWVSFALATKTGTKYVRVTVAAELNALKGDITELTKLYRLGGAPRWAMIADQL